MARNAACQPSAVSAVERPLDRDGAADGLHRTRKLDHDAIAGHAENPTLMLCHQAGDDLRVARQGSQRRLFVLRHQTAVAGNVGGPDYGEMPFDLGGWHD
ncbi:MAG: hypothetical protein ACREIR_21950 [Geminicoccaceae bacterium]